MKKILVVEDDNTIHKIIEDILKKEHYIVISAYSGTEAISIIENDNIDLILLDLMLPGINGEDIVKKVNKTLPIIVISAKTSSVDKAKVLLEGANDYITKPFSMDELVARISAHLRREERKHEASNLRFDDELIINYDSHTVFYKEKQLEFSNKEFEIIRLLSQNAGMVFDRETIYEKLWGYDGEGDSIVVKEHIRKIRNKLSAYTDKNYIQTVWGVGHRWEK